MLNGMGTLGRPAKESCLGQAEEQVPIDEMKKEWSKGWGGGEGGEPHPQRRAFHDSGGSHSIRACSGTIEPKA